MKLLNFSLFFTLFILLNLNLNDAREKAPECEVCVEVIDLATEALSESDRNSLDKVETSLDKYCAKKDLSATHKKLCYYIKPIKREVSQPFKNGVPTEKICSRLKKKSAEICSVRPPVEIEKGVTDYNTLRIKQLKKILADRGVVCENCLEKSEFVKRCKETEHLEL